MARSAFDKAMKRRPWREEFFRTITKELCRQNFRALTVLELGSGPGFLAQRGDLQTVVPLPSPLIQKFDLWGTLTPDSKLAFYSGWANGLFTTTKDPGTLALGRCLEKLTFEQILAMVDKRFADHRKDREGYHNPISTEIIEALTVASLLVSLQKLKLADHETK
jgi:hypothetical protein